MLRHEIIALHLAEAPGGAEFYPSCSQILIKGSGTGTPDETVSFPGAYSDTDKGIKVNAFDASAKYVFPGGPIATLSGGSAAPVNAGSSPSVSASTPAETEPADSESTAAPSSTKTAKGSSSTKGCKSSSKRMVKRHARLSSH